MSQISVFDVKTKIRIYCEEVYQPQAEWTLNTLKRIFEENDSLCDGVKIKFGWTVFTLQYKNAEFLVLEPNFLENPFEDLSYDITTSVSVLVKQRDFIAKIGVKPKEISFQDKVILAKGSLSETKIYLERSDTTKKNDSGWFIGYVEDESNKNKQLEAIYLYELLKFRSSLLKVLNLPTNFLVIFNGDKVQSVLNENDKQIYSEVDN